MKWSLTGPGSLSSTTGASVIYNAPRGSNITTVQSATVTAIAVADPTKSALLEISVNPLPFFTNFNGLPGGNAGVAYNQSIGFSGGTPPFAWSAGNGALPAGLTLDPKAGIISGTPTQGGTWYFTVNVSDAVGSSSSRDYSIKVQQQVTGNNPVPFLTQPLAPSSTAPGGDAFTLTVNGTGFLSTSTVKFDGTALETKFINQGKLQAVVPATSIASPGTRSVTVMSPSPGGGSSNVIYFPVASPETAPNFAVAPPVPIATLFVESAASADFNQDGKADLAIGYQGNLAVLLGNGDGTFTVASGSPFENPYVSVVGSLFSADFFNSARPGLAAIGGQIQTIAVFNGDGDGTLTLSPTRVIASSLASPTAADINGDGYLDLLTSSGALLGYGNGAFNAVGIPSLPSSIPFGSLGVGDFNGDGKLDFATCLLGNGNFKAPPGGVQVFLGNGDGTFTASAAAMIQNPQTDGLVVADFNGDDKLDLAFETFPANGSIPSLNIMLGNGDGTFAPASSSSIKVPDVSPVSPSIVGDFLNHGKLDLIVGGDFLAGNGDGTFQSPIRLQFPAGIPQAMGDFNGSGRLGFAALGTGFANSDLGVVVQQ